MPRILFALLVLCSGAYAVDLEFASNDQILRELARRLNSGSPAEAGRADYICDSSGYLNVNLTGTATAQKRQIYTGSYSHCTEQANLLAASKARITSLTTAAACDSSGYLYRYSLTPAGNIADLGNTYTGSYSNCVEQAKQINQGSR
jgi:hypothetical protein